MFGYNDGIFAEIKVRLSNQRALGQLPHMEVLASAFNHKKPNNLNELYHF